MALPASALTTLATANDELGLTSDSGTQDARVERYIKAASSQIATFLGRSLHNTAGIIEKLEGYGTPFLYVSRTPLGTLTSIKYDGQLIDSSNYEVHDANEGSIYAKGGFLWTAAVREGMIPEAMAGYERRLYEVTYTGGWICPTQAGTRDLPEEIEQACLELVVLRWRARGRDPSIKSESLMSWSASYDRGGSDSEISDGGMPPAVAEMLRPWRRTPIA